MNIITVTVNPALDIHLDSPSFAFGGYNNARVLSRDSAGKGVNVSRALCANGIDNLCYMIVGREGYEDFISPLLSCGMNLAYTLTDGRVRENINIHHIGEETVIATPGPAVRDREVSDMEGVIIPRLSADSLLVFSGSISSSSDKERILASLHKMKATGARLVIDSKSIETEELISLRPYLVKPNESEAEYLTGISITDIGSAIKAATAIRDMGCENVLLTLGAAGAVLAAKDGVYAATVPIVDVKSTVGAGDSTIAGFLEATLSSSDSEAKLRSALAYGTAACMEEGSMPPIPSRVSALISEISVTKHKNM